MSILSTVPERLPKIVAKQRWIALSKRDAKLDGEAALVLTSPAEADPPCVVQSSELTKIDNETDRPIREPRVARERALCDRGAEPCAGGGQHFSQAPAVTREPRCAGRSLRKMLPTTRSEE